MAGYYTDYDDRGINLNFVVAAADDAIAAAVDLPSPQMLSPQL